MRRSAEIIGAGVASLAFIAGGVACKTVESNANTQGYNCNRTPFQTREVTPKYTLLNRSCDQGVNAITLYKKGSDKNKVDENSTIFIPKTANKVNDFIPEPDSFKAILISIENGSIADATEESFTYPTPNPVIQ